MKKVNLKVSGVYGASWSKNAADRDLNKIYGAFSYVLSFAEDANGTLNLDADSQVKYDALLRKLDDDIRHAEHAQIHFPSWKLGEVLIQDLDNNDSDDNTLVFNVNDLKSLKALRQYVKDKLLHAELPLKSDAVLRRNNYVHPDVTVVNGNSVGRAETKVCVVYGFKTHQGLVVDTQVSINLRLICKNSVSWHLIDEKDPKGNYNCSSDAYSLIQEKLNQDMAELKKAGKPVTWYSGYVVVVSEYKWEHSSSHGTSGASFPIESLEDFLYFNTYVQERLPRFEPPLDDTNQKVSSVVRVNSSQSSPIVHAFSRSDDKLQPLIAKPQLEEDSEEPCCGSFLRKVLGFNG